MLSFLKNPHVKLSIKKVKSKKKLLTPVKRFKEKSHQTHVKKDTNSHK